jgi:hypothetical protein
VSYDVKERIRKEDDKRLEIIQDINSKKERETSLEVQLRRGRNHGVVIMMAGEIVDVRVDRLAL